MITRQSDNFYGTGESYLFRFGKEKEAQHFTWTKKNDYFQYSNLEGLAMGCGGKGYGLYVGKNL